MIIHIENNPTEKEIKITEFEMEKESSLICKQYLEGKLYILRELYKSGIIIPKSLQSNYTLKKLKEKEVLKC